MTLTPIAEGDLGSVVRSKINTGFTQVDSTAADVSSLTSEVRSGRIWYTEETSPQTTSPPPATDIVLTSAGTGLLIWKRIPPPLNTTQTATRVHDLDGSWWEVEWDAFEGTVTNVAVDDLTAEVRDQRFYRIDSALPNLAVLPAGTELIYCTTPATGLSVIWQKADPDSGLSGLIRNVPSDTWWRKVWEKTEFALLNDIVPSLNMTGSFASPPTSGTLGSAWKQNALYRNTTDGKVYILTGTPLDWIQYFEDGVVFYLTIESTQGTIFRVGGGTTTQLRAHLFKNGAEITSSVSASLFRWRRVSSNTAADTVWNADYLSGYKAIDINVDDVAARATFFCDVSSS